MLIFSNFLLFYLLCKICFSQVEAFEVDAQLYKVDNFHVIGFADSMRPNVCIAIQSAVLAGLTYHLIGIPDSLSNVTQNKKLIKIFAYDNILDNLSDKKEDIVLFADSFDVIFQPNVSMIKDYVLKNPEILLFNGERNCWPATYPHLHSYRCPLVHGEEFYKLRDKGIINITVSTLCNKQELRSPANRNHNKYLNSGVSFGTVKAHHLVVKRVKKQVSELPLLCMVDDQGLFQQDFVDFANIKLDYDDQFLESQNNKNNEFNEEMGMFKNVAGFTPNVLHFNGDKSKIHWKWNIIFKWWVKKIGIEAVNKKLTETKVDIFGKLVPLVEICTHLLL
jgi:hypothetical protein